MSRPHEKPLPVAPRPVRRWTLRDAIGEAAELARTEPGGLERFLTELRDAIAPRGLRRRP